MNTVDVAVIGSGHNALVAACYLARAGRGVEVLERDSVLGGAVSTVARFPGHRVDRGSSAHIMIRHTEILDELDLDVRYLDCDPWAFAPAPPGSGLAPIVFRRDLARTCAAIEAACGAADADAYRRFVEVWEPRSARVMRAFRTRPTGAGLLRSFWGLDARGGGSALSREFLTSGNALLDGYFRDERLKAALAWFGAQSGPPMTEPGTAPMVGFAALMHRIPPGRAVGGSGALTEALVRRLHVDGGVTSAGDAVVELRRRGRGWLVRTAGGRELQARTVIAGCHVLTTLDLLERGGFDVEPWRRGIRVGPGVGMVVRLATSQLPTYPGATPAESATGLQLLVHDRRQLARAHDGLHAGRPPGRPAVLAMSFSAIDPTIAPRGEHQLTLWSQWHAYDLPWPEIGNAEADRIVAELDSYAPGFRDTIRNRHVQTPHDLETELGLRGGNVMHVEMSLDQMLLWRPTADLSGYRVPGAPGLYLTGASTHPGGGVSGASGRSVARLVVSDQRFRR